MFLHGGHVSDASFSISSSRSANFLAQQNHHVHDILLSIPLGVAIAILAYRAHYASLFDYKTNHLYLPWSVTNRSVTIANTAAVAGAQDGTGFQTEKKRNKTAVPWPRAPKSRSESEVHGLGTGLGLDRAADMNRRIYGPLILRGGRMRQDLFPEAREATLRGNGGSEIVLPNGNGDLARYPVEMDGTGAEVPPVRFQVEDWANETGSGAVRRRVNLSGGEMV